MKKPTRIVAPVDWLPAVAIARIYERLGVARRETKNPRVARELNMCLMRLQGEKFKGMCMVCGCSQTHACRLPGQRCCSWTDRTETLCNNPECIAAMALVKAAKKVTKHVLQGSKIPPEVQVELERLRALFAAVRGAGL